MNKILLYILLLACISTVELHPAASSSSAAAAAAAGAGRSSSSLSQEDRKKKEALRRLELQEAAARDRHNLTQQALNTRFEQEQLLKVVSAEAAIRSEKKDKDATISHEDSDDAVGITPPITLLPDSCHTSFRAGQAVAFQRAYTLFSTVQKNTLPLELVKLILDYLPSQDNPDINALRWASDAIDIKEMYLDKDHEYFTHSCWLGNNYIVHLENVPLESTHRDLIIRDITTPEKSPKRQPIDGNTDALSCSANPKMPFIATANKGGIVTFWDKDLNQCGTLKDTTGPHDHTLISWSPDGTKLCIVTFDPCTILKSDDLNDFLGHPPYPERIGSLPKKLSIFSVDQDGPLVTATPYYEYSLPYNPRTQDCHCTLNWTSDGNYCIFTSIHYERTSNPHWHHRKIDSPIHTIDVGTKRVLSSNIQHNLPGTIDYSGRYLLSSAFNAANILPTLIITPLCNSLRPLPLTVPKCQDTALYFEKSHRSHVTDVCCTLPGLVIVEGYYQDKPLIGHELDCKKFILIIDAKSGKIIKALNYKNIYDFKLSPDSSKAFLHFREDSNHRYGTGIHYTSQHKFVILTPLSSLEQIPRKIATMQLMQKMHTINTLRSLLYYLKLRQRISSAYTLAQLPPELTFMQKLNRSMRSAWTAQSPRSVESAAAAAAAGAAGELPVIFGLDSSTRLDNLNTCH